MTIAMLILAAALSPAAEKKTQIASAEPAKMEAAEVQAAPECMYRLQQVLRVIEQERRGEGQAQRGDDQQAELSHVGG